MNVVIIYTLINTSHTLVNMHGCIIKMYNNTIKIFYQNVRGLRTKCLDFKHQLSLNEYDILLITETWLCEGILDRELCDDRYDVFRMDRDLSATGKTIGGGVMICTRRELGALVRSEWHRIPTEMLWITIPNRTTEAVLPSLHIGLTYIVGEPRTQPTNIENVIDSIKNATDAYPSDHFALIGDFNLPDIR